MFKKKIDIIWTLTRICPYYCSICCVDAIQVIRKKNNLILTSGYKQNKKCYYLPFNDKNKDIYSHANKKLVKEGKELSFKGKMQILKNLRGENVKIDFSGGDPLLLPETIILISKASEYFGKSNITLTSTGVGLNKIIKLDNYLIKSIGEINFTYDSFYKKNLKYREKNYTNTTLDIIKKIAKFGVKTRAEIPLSDDNLNKEFLTKIYKELYEANIDKLLIMRLFPSGRCNISKITLSKDKYIEAITVLKKLENMYGRPKIKLQCALKYLWKKNLKENPCDMVSNSFGLTSNGILLASPWAIGINGNPIDKKFVLGDLSKKNIREILSSKKVKIFLKRKNENFGHCKMHAYFSDPQLKDSCFKKKDPLYSEK